MLILRDSIKTRDDALRRTIDIERDLQLQRRFQQRPAKGVGLHELQIDDYSQDPYQQSPADADALSEVQATLAELKAERKAWQQRKKPAAAGKGPPPGQPLVPGRDGKQVPVQCYKCKAWGHLQRQCPGKSQPGNG